MYEASQAIAFLARRREGLGVKQDALGRRVGVSQSTVSQFEKVNDCLVSRLARYADALGFEMDIVFTPKRPAGE